MPPRKRSTYIACICTGLVVGVLFDPVDPVRGAEFPWRVGVARVCITPPEPIPLCGYNPDLSEGVLDDLYAKALALDDGRGGRGLLLTADLLFFRQPFAEALCRRITERTGLARHQILLSASHTHAGPVFGLRDPDRFDLPAAQRAVVDAYTRRLMDQLVDLAAAALADTRPARLDWGSGQVGFVMNRRLRTEHGIIMSPNPDGEVDPVVPVLRVTDAEGGVRAILFGCACHPVTLDGHNRKISADYAGAAQRRLEERFAGAQAMFLIGCGGDANSHPRGGPEQEQWVLRHGEELADEVTRVLAGPLHPVRAPLRPVLQWTELPLDDTWSREELQRMADQGSTPWHRHNGQQLLTRLDRGQPLPTAYRAAVSAWQFGQDLTLIGLPGEAVAAYVRRLQDALGPDRLWIAAYTNESFGYLPTAQILAEGGHESMCLTLDVGFFHPSIEEFVVEAVRGIAQAAGRPQ